MTRRAIRPTSSGVTTPGCRPASYDPRLRTARWRKLRLWILNRDQWVCGYCGGDANTVDHRVRREDGGPMFDPENLVACCGPCQNENLRRVFLRRHAPDASQRRISLPFEPIRGDLTRR